ncbi:MAG: FtsW/RodA/SpoVE family cell cycle protein [Christensenellales bacterium]|jgi:cell division protein FtsW
MSQRKNFDYLIMLIVVGLVLFGVVMVFSASYYSYQVREGDGLSRFIKQLQGAAIGLALMIILAFVDYHVLQRALIPVGLLLISIAFLVVVLFTEEDILGAKRWLDLGFISFQPSEVARFALLVFCADWLSRFRREVTGRDFRKFMRGMSAPFLAAGVVCGLILAGNSLSMTIATALMFFCLLVTVGISGRILALTGTGVGVLGAVFTFIAPYRVARFTIFTNPWKDPRDSGFQLIQSLYALGAGGLFGVGLGNSRQKYLFLTYCESDFILSIIGEELGFLGVTVLLIFFMALIWRGTLTAMYAPDTFGLLMAAGITALIAIQVIINVAVVTSSMPPTGVPLPFISAGNTSLIIFMSEIGVLLNISSQRKRQA